MLVVCYLWRKPSQPGVRQALGYDGEAHGEPRYHVTLEFSQSATTKQHIAQTRTGDTQY